MYVCMYVCMHVCEATGHWFLSYVCMYIYMCVCVYVCMCVRQKVDAGILNRVVCLLKYCVRVCMYVCMCMQARSPV